MKHSVVLTKEPVGPKLRRLTDRLFGLTLLCGYK